MRRQAEDTKDRQDNKNERREQDKVQNDKARKELERKMEGMWNIFHS